MKKTAVLICLVLAVCIILSSCGKSPSEPLSHDAPATEDIAVTSTIPEETESTDTFTSDPDPVLNDEELRYDVVSVKFPSLLLGPSKVSYLNPMNSEINGFLDALSKLEFCDDNKLEDFSFGSDVNTYSIIETETDTYVIGFWGEMISIHPDVRFSLESNLENTVWYKFDRDGEVFAFMRNLYEKVVEETPKKENPRAFEAKPPEDRFMDDEELRYNIMSVKFGKLNWKSWTVYNYYLTNSEINTFLDGLTAIDFWKEDNPNVAAGGDIPVVIETENEKYVFLINDTNLLIYSPSGDFSLEGWTSVEYYSCSEDNNLYAFYRELAERVVKEYLDEKYRSDND